MANTENSFKKGDLLTKMECCDVFCDKMRIGQNTYYKNFRHHIKFKPYSSQLDDEGNIEPALYRIPYEIVIGLINLLREQPAPDDPPREQLLKFMKNVKEGV